MALAGFTPGQAEALRRAMSRKRSREAMLELWRDFRDGARERGVDDETIRGVFTKLIGFSNFGFPKAHSSAFAVLAYQSAWLRQRYPAEFLASLLNAQPMGFYPPASLVRDAQRRGVRVLPPCVARSQAVCAMEDGAVRVGLGYVREVRRDAAARLVDRARGRRPLPRHRRPGRALRAAARAARPAGARRRLRRLRAAAPGDAVGAGRAGATAGRRARHPAGPADPGRPGAAPARADPLRAHHHRLRDDRPVHRLAPGDAGAPRPAPGGPHGRAAARDPPRHRRPGGRPGGGAPAARDGRGHRLPAAGGRDRDGQLHREAARCTSATAPWCGPTPW